MDGAGDTSGIGGGAVGVGGEVEGGESGCAEDAATGVGRGGTRVAGSRRGMKEVGSAARRRGSSAARSMVAKAVVRKEGDSREQEGDSREQEGRRRVGCWGGVRWRNAMSGSDEDDGNGSGGGKKFFPFFFYVCCVTYSALRARRGGGGWKECWRCGAGVAARFAAALKWF